MGSLRVLKLTAVMTIGLLLGACTYQQSLRHPKLPPLVPIDRTMDCRQIDLAIDRADTVRWLIRDDGGHTVLNAADGRIRELLQLKRDRGCPARATTLPGMDDLALLVELEAVQVQLDAGRGEQAALFGQRTKLLDGLRVVPPLVPTSP